MPTTNELVPAIIQARLGSARLPGKSLRRLGSKTALERVVAAAGQFADPVIVATSTAPADEALVDAAESLGIPCVRGPLEDVYSRYRIALEHPRCLGAEWFFRVTGDCPLLSPTLARLLLSHRSEALDYLYLADDELPRGLAPELVRKHAFLRISKLSSDEREHVTLALYGRGESSRTGKINPPKPFQRPDFRLTLDYPEDAALFDRLFELDDAITAEQAISVLRDRADLSRINSDARTAAPELRSATP